LGDGEKIGKEGQCEEEGTEEDVESNDQPNRSTL